MCGAEEHGRDKKRVSRIEKMIFLEKRRSFFRGKIFYGVFALLGGGGLGGGARFLREHAVPLAMR